jgi:aryl-alcohol dehydrogenase-like predicted oxidoreductase
MYNLAKRQAEVEILPMAIEMGLGVCSYSPLAGGLLTGKYAAAAAGGFAAASAGGAQGRLATNAMYQTRYGDRINHDIAAGLGAIAREVGHHPASVAVAWVAGHPGITAPILGARNLEQLEPSLKALEVPMTAELRERISSLSPTPPPAHDRSEEKR